MMQFFFFSTLVAFLSVYLYGAFIPSFCIYLVTKSSIKNPNRNRTLALENLIQAPTIGHFFYEQLIHDYVYLEEWEKIVNKSKEAIEWQLHKDNFVIWYYKATAECLLLNIQQCQRSTRIANGLSPHGQDSSVSHLYQLAEVLKYSKALRMVKQGNDFMVIYDKNQINAQATLSQPPKEMVGEQLENEFDGLKVHPEIAQLQINLEHF